MSFSLPFTVMMSTSRRRSRNAGRQHLRRRCREDHLSALGEPDHSRRDVDRIAEDVTVALDRGTAVEADAKRNAVVARLREIGHAGLDLGRR